MRGGEELDKLMMFFYLFFVADFVLKKHPDRIKNHVERIEFLSSYHRDVFVFIIWKILRKELKQEGFRCFQYF